MKNILEAILQKKGDDKDVPVAFIFKNDKFSEWKWCKISEIPSNFINPEALKLI